ncbi:MULTISPECIES: metal-sensing transcriptional repressor [Hungatella]|uniref:Metal-sensing transcriptional repressor n=1 Tax=Hungatella hathewayi TaxID=154046 RepID=A0AAW9W9P7_9FIRM|nr:MULTISPECIES: metal-sensing transcriptional repressor [Hungatella]MCQ4827777.1 metal-sensing transcriptional repressor [Hungatella sp. SL.1.14]MUB61880.1 metal-sensing transcriptional repressor [Hungatella hathewayi]CUP48345.1 copper-sensing transcriptional repressor CsoR [Hungatella hathewayi]
MEERTCDCAVKHKHRQAAEEKDLLNRLNRIEGQIRGIKSMVEDERYCVDILTQVSAVQAALNSFNKVLLSNHIKSCVVEQIQEGNLEAVDELCMTIQKVMK